MIYINKMSQYFNLKTTHFADDMFFYSKNNLNDKAVEKFDCKITIKTTKTTDIIFTHQSSKLTSKINIQNNTINLTNSFKYIDIHVDNKLKLAKQTKRASSQTLATKHKNYHLLTNNSTLSQRMKHCIYNIYIKLILLYAASFWIARIFLFNMNKFTGREGMMIKEMQGRKRKKRNGGMN